MLKIDHHNSAFPLVSIVIPAYNSAQYLPECIVSCLEQSYSNLEIIVVDDGSTDNTKEVLRPYQGRIVYYCQQNHGLAGARNAGHRIAKGEYIAWLDADDIAHPDRILLQAVYMERHPEVVLVCTNFSAFDEMGKKYNEYATQYYSQLQALGGVGEILPETENFDARGNFAVNSSLVSAKVFAGDARYTLIWGNFIHPPTVMMRNTGCRRAGELKRNIPTQEDWEYFFRVSRYGKIAWIDSPLLQYRLHAQQMSSTGNAVKNATGIVSVFEDMLESEQEYAKQHKRDVRKALSRYCASAAYALIENKNKAEALTYMKKSFKCNPMRWIHYKLTVKWLLS